MCFNPDPSKQAKEIVFSRKRSNNQLPVLMFNSSIISPGVSHKHLGMILDSKLNFNNHLCEKISKANKGMGIIRRLYNVLPRATLINIYKAFVRPHLHYGDIIYDNSSNSTFSQMIESVQYNAALAITGAIRGSSREKLYRELGFESLHDRRWYRKLCFYYKILHANCNLFLLWNPAVIAFGQIAVQMFLSSELNVLSLHFPSSTFNWNQLDPSIQNSSSVEIFKRSLLKFIRPKPEQVFKIHHPKGLKLLT